MPNSRPIQHDLSYEHVHVATYSIGDRMADTDSEGNQSQFLLVEDNPGDARLVKETLKNRDRPITLHIVSTGEEALNFVRQRGEYTDVPEPEIILLDWHLPGRDGPEVVAELTTDPDYAHIPIIVLTGSQAEQDVLEAYKQHANACITKEPDPEALEETFRAVEHFWLTTAELP